MPDARVPERFVEHVTASLDADFVGQRGQLFAHPQERITAQQPKGSGVLLAIAASIARAVGQCIMVGKARSAKEIAATAALPDGHARFTSVVTPGRGSRSLLRKNL